MTNQAVEIKILGKMTRVNCPPGQEESLLKAADFLSSRLEDLMARTKVTNETQLLTIAALNICYELQAKNQDMQDQLNMAQRIEQLTFVLDDAIRNVKVS